MLSHFNSGILHISNSIRDSVGMVIDRMLYLADIIHVLCNLGSHRFKFPFEPLLPRDNAVHFNVHFFEGFRTYSVNSVGVVGLSVPAALLALAPRVLVLSLLIVSDTWYNRMKLVTRATQNMRARCGQ